MAVALAPAGGLEHPLVQLLATLAERVFECRVRPGDIAVERHRYLERQLAHGILLQVVWKIRPPLGRRLIASVGDAGLRPRRRLTGSQARAVRRRGGRAQRERAHSGPGGHALRRLTLARARRRGGDDMAGSASRTPWLRGPGAAAAR